MVVAACWKGLHTLFWYSKVSKVRTSWSVFRYGSDKMVNWRAKIWNSNVVCLHFTSNNLQAGAHRTTHACNVLRRWSTRLRRFNWSLGIKGLEVLARLWTRLWCMWGHRQLLSHNGWLASKQNIIPYQSMNIQHIGDVKVLRFNWRTISFSNRHSGQSLQPDFPKNLYYSLQYLTARVHPTPSSNQSAYICSPPPVSTRVYAVFLRSSNPPLFFPGNASQLLPCVCNIWQLTPSDIHITRCPSQYLHQ